jgi:ubiquinone/menaquinone biosynthesis C-methylase UbiE
MMDGLTTFEQVSPRIWTSLPGSARTASYDAVAHGYDLLVGNGIYNRLVWGCSKAAYADAARNFLSRNPDGAIIDYGCGSLVFTAEQYRGHEDRLTLFDLSLGMMRRGEKRLPKGRFLQGNALNPPFAANSFDGALSWGMLHVFGSGSANLPALEKLLKPGAPVSLTCLVLADRIVGDHMLGVLIKKGEVAVAERAGEVSATFAQYFDIESQAQCGNMLFLTGRKRT